MPRKVFLAVTLPSTGMARAVLSPCPHSMSPLPSCQSVPEAGTQSAPIPAGDLRAVLHRSPDSPLGQHLRAPTWCSSSCPKLWCSAPRGLRGCCRGRCCPEQTEYCISSTSWEGAGLEARQQVVNPAKPKTFEIFPFPAIQRWGCLC